MESLPLPRRFLLALRNALYPAFKTIRFLLVIMVPVSLAVLLLDSSGLLARIAIWLNPLMHALGLPGEASLVFLSSITMNLYSAIALAGTLALNPRELIILASMCLIAHALIVECAIMKRTGSSAIKMTVLRILAAIIAAWILNRLLPQSYTTPKETLDHLHNALPPLSNENLPSLLLMWLKDSGLLILKLSSIIISLMFLQKLFEEFKVLDTLSRILHPLMGLMGLPSTTSFLWLVANTIGLGYGSAILIEQTDKGHVSLKDADLLNHHLAISHSLLEDSLLFVALGVPPLLAILPRFILALCSVWLERIRRLWVLNSFRVGVMN